MTDNISYPGHWSFSNAESREARLEEVTNDMITEQLDPVLVVGFTKNGESFMTTTSDDPVLVYYLAKQLVSLTEEYLEQISISRIRHKFGKEDN